MTRSVPIVVLGLLVGLPAAGAAGSLDLRGGGSFPRADSQLFRDDAELYHRERDDGTFELLDNDSWRGWSGGIGYNWHLTRGLELGVHLDGGTRSLQTTYRDFQRPSGAEIRQTLELSVVPLGAELRFVPRSGRGEFTPFVSAGVDAVFYRYEEFGDFIDFFDPERPILRDSFIDEGAAAGFHVAGGLRFPLGDDFNLVAEGRYLWAEADMGDDFRGNRIDLSGFRATLGLNVRF